MDRWRVCARAPVDGHWLVTDSLLAIDPVVRHQRVGYRGGLYYCLVCASGDLP